jgi:hypothetical protein
MYEILKLGDTWVNGVNAPDTQDNTDPHFIKKPMFLFFAIFFVEDVESNVFDSETQHEVDETREEK